MSEEECMRQVESGLYWEGQEGNYHIFTSVIDREGHQKQAVNVALELSGRDDGDVKSRMTVTTREWIHASEETVPENLLEDYFESLEKNRCELPYAKE